jgi:hypothetical protein
MNVNRQSNIKPDILKHLHSEEEAIKLFLLSVFISQKLDMADE